LIVGLVGFFATLAIPWSATMPSAMLRAAGLTLLSAGLVTLLVGRGRRGLAVTAAGLLSVGAIALAAPFLLAMPSQARATFAVTVLMGAWWMTVAIPIPATSILPMVLFPVLGILPSGTTASNYTNNNIFLFMGGFILALGIQRWSLHRRIALHVVHVVGTNPARMVLGFMLATAFLSMWISNTATALMMLPIALAVIGSMREVAEGKSMGGFAPALLLGVAYSASIGGLATPIGTPPNISFLRILEILYPEAPTYSFGRWIVAFLPLVVLFLPITWLLLTRVVHRLRRESVGAGRQVIEEGLAGLGPMSPSEKRMLWVFTTTAILWITRGDLVLGSLVIPGWAGLLERSLGLEYLSGYLHDATVAVAMAVLTFLIPGEPDKHGRPRKLMDWETAVQLPWGILLLFGGGFALALAYKESGLSRYLGESFAGHLQGLHPILLVAGICFLLTFLTEVTSNTATTEVVLPVLAGTAGAMGVNPLMLMIPATLSASCAFMLPIATPPNAIVFGSGELEMRQMVRAGVLLNFIGVILISLIFYFLSSRLLGIDLGTVPVWAVSQ
jgi:sodium-dependent dicarboxylate transporter 2/3/5